VHIPLTSNQKLQLLLGCLPLAAFLVLVAAYFVAAFYGSLPMPSALFYAFLLVILVLFGYQALQRLRDLAAGVALVDEDVLLRSWHASANSNDIYAKFERLGILQISPKVAPAIKGGTHFRVAYSPASKIAWAVERLEF
jgi:hypothetical protein